MTPVPHIVDAYRLGWEAAASGDDYEDCPFDQDTPGEALWAQGYEECDEVEEHA